jgi:hypothetical protein
MAKIYSPNKSYTGLSASVAFSKGVGETEENHLIEWFKEHGYTVEEEAQAENPGQQNDNGQATPPDNNTQKAITDMTVEELTAYAKEKNIDIGQATTQAGILKKIQDAETAETTETNTAAQAPTK